MIYPRGGITCHLHSLNYLPISSDFPFSGYHPICPCFEFIDVCEDFLDTFQRSTAEQRQTLAQQFPANAGFLEAFSPQSLTIGILIEYFTLPNGVQDFERISALSKALSVHHTHSYNSIMCDFVFSFLGRMRFF